MYEELRTIRLRETDATGVLYFSEQLKLALEAFESCLCEKGFGIKEILSKSEFLLPIVHVEAEYKMPLRVGDQVKIQLWLEKVGNSSFTLKAIFWLRGKEAGETTIVHVTTCLKTGKSIPIPPLLMTALQGMRKDLPVFGNFIPR